MVSAYILNLGNKNRPPLFRFFPVIIAFGIFLIISFKNLSATLFDKISQRIFEDSRSIVYNFFFNDIQEYIFFGKGMYGKYYCPMRGGIPEEGILWAQVEYREVVETGYLQLLLSGGIVHIILFILLLFPAAYYGIFKSCNQFARACGIIIFLWLLDMFIYGLPALSLHYIFVWICVGICYNPVIRNKTDNELRIEFLTSEFV
jgi:hypothetical protein